MYEQIEHDVYEFSKLDVGYRLTKRFPHTFSLYSVEEFKQEQPKKKILLHMNPTALFDA
jgi:hypothetical protein